MSEFLVVVGIFAGLGMIGVGVAYGFRWMMETMTVMTTKQVEGLGKIQLETMERTASVVEKAVVGSTQQVLEAAYSTIVGRPGVEVPQPEPTEQLMDPSWMTWYEEHVDKVGVADVGDSVWFNRTAEDHRGTAMLGDGEAIIPGVPLPDMGGERFGEDE